MGITRVTGAELRYELLVRRRTYIGEGFERRGVEQQEKSPCKTTVAAIVAVSVVGNDASVHERRKQETRCRRTRFGICQLQLLVSASSQLIQSP